MQPGFCIIHANQLETLAALAIAHSASEPLPPLEPDIFLVQSNGMADWLKLKQAETTGVSASLAFPMPASFLWQMYQQVLNPSLLDAPSPFAKDSMQWRLLRLLPDLLAQPEFARPRRFLDGDTGQTRRFQLARKLADLFDQYQLYRADWIQAWEAGRLLDLGQDEAWQAALWRALLASLPEAERQLSRAHLHAAFIDALQGDTTPAGLPKRLFLFGINSMPQQLLEALYAMSRHCQLLLLILSPCREYWGDKGIADLDGFAASSPLLDSWGAQGRDFLKLLQSCEASELALQLTQEINPYADAAEHTRPDSIICQLQQALLDNCLPETGQPLPPDPGLGFYPAYSRQREVEVLHDQLLALFARDPSLQYSDVVVMMPNVDPYVAHIEAVFGRYPRDDARHLAYSISDRSAQDAPLYQAIDYLLNLPAQRLTLSEVLSLLKLPAIQLATGIDEDALAQLQDWCDASHIRWAQDAEHRRQLLGLPDGNLPDWRAHNTWRAGLDQLLAGYCAGSADLFSCAPLDEVTASQGHLLGLLIDFTEKLGQFRLRLQGNDTPSGWAVTFTQLLDTFFAAASDDDRLLLGQLNSALGAWQADCALAGFDIALPLAQARQGWLDQLDQAGMSQQLSFNGITFCTLMPMRALPFRHVFLLGMNDEDYPHATAPMDFDLMQDNYRPGDRDRRSDDQYLFLEALMSVRDSLHISWVGRDINRDEERPVCTLVAQLRDLVNRCWKTGQTDTDGKSISACDALTRQLPLAAFGQRYFLPAASTPPNLWPSLQPPRTYASEWLRLYQPITSQPPETTSANFPDTLTCRQLAGLLQAPEKVFYRDRLGVQFDEIDTSLEDDEPFAADGLTLWKVRAALLDDLLAEAEPNLSCWQKNGALPSGALTAALLQAELDSARSIQRRWQENLDGATPTKPKELSLPLTTGDSHCTLTATLDPLFLKKKQLLLATTSASNLFKQGWRFDKLAQPWVTHLAACAAGLTASTHLVSRDKQVHFAPLSAAEARRQLERLFALYVAAWQQPLLLDDLKLDRESDIQIPDNNLPAAIATHWPNGDTDDTNAFFAELLYRPLQQALAGGAP